MIERLQQEFVFLGGIRGLTPFFPPFFDLAARVQSRRKVEKQQKETKEKTREIEGGKK